MSNDIETSGEFVEIACVKCLTRFTVYVKEIYYRLRLELEQDEHNPSYYVAFRVEEPIQCPQCQTNLMDGQFATSDDLIKWHTLEIMFTGIDQMADDLEADYPEIFYEEDSQAIQELLEARYSKETLETLGSTLRGVLPREALDMLEHESEPSLPEYSEPPRESPSFSINVRLCTDQEFEKLVMNSDGTIALPHYPRNPNDAILTLEGLLYEKLQVTEITCYHAVHLPNDIELAAELPVVLPDEVMINLIRAFRKFKERNTLSSSSEFLGAIFITKYKKKYPSLKRILNQRQTSRQLRQLIYQERCKSEEDFSEVRWQIYVGMLIECAKTSVEARNNLFEICWFFGEFLSDLTFSLAKILRQHYQQLFTYITKQLDSLYYCTTCHKYLIPSLLLETLLYVPYVPESSIEHLLEQHQRLPPTFLTSSLNMIKGKEIVSPQLSTTLKELLEQHYSSKGIIGYAIQTVLEFEVDTKKEKRTSNILQQPSPDSSEKRLFTQKLNKILTKEVRKRLAQYEPTFTKPPTWFEEPILAKIESTLLYVAQSNNLVDHDLEQGLEAFLKAQKYPEYKMSISDLLSNSAQQVYQTLWAEKDYLYDGEDPKVVIKSLYRILSSVKFHKTRSSNSRKYIEFVQQFL